MWQALQAAFSKTRAPASASALGRTCGGGASKRMKSASVVDVALAGGRIDGVLDVGDLVELRQQVGAAVGRVLGREQPAGDAHLVEVGIAGEGQQGGVLRFPAEAARHA